VRTNIGDTSFVEEQIEICFKDIGIVSDNDRCAVSQGPAQIVRNLLHGPGVKARARLVNDYQAMRSTEKLRQTEPATLTSTGRPALAGGSAEADAPRANAQPEAWFVAVLFGAATLVFGIVPSPLFDLAVKAGKAFPNLF